MLKKTTGFTLIELLVVIAIIAVLAAVILFSVVQYINKGKDSSIQGNLAVLVPAGEAFYNIGNTYENFCSGNAVTNAISQMPENPSGICAGNDAGLCCNVIENGSAWMACAKGFTDPTKAFCADSRGIKGIVSIYNCFQGVIYMCNLYSE